jgi:hypothetical protein
MMFFGQVMTKLQLLRCKSQSSGVKCSATGCWIVLYDAKNNKNSPETSTSLPREAGQEHACVRAVPGPPPLPRQVRPEIGTSSGLPYRFPSSEGALP